MSGTPAEPRPLVAVAARSRYQEIRALVYLAFCRLGEEPAAALDLARSAVKLAREADIPSGLAFGRVAVAQALAAAGHPVEAAAEAAAAAALLEQAVVDGSEEILLCHARLAGAAGEHQVAATAWARAVAEVERKSLRLRDPVRRRLYLEQPLIRAIREGAAQAHSGGG